MLLANTLHLHLDRLRQPSPPDRFRRFSQSGRILLLLLGFLLSWPVAAHPVATTHVQAELIGETTAIQPGQPFWVALRLQMRDGWHVYWRNPGDSGLAPTLTWTLPAGFSAGEIQWPYPERIPVGPLMNFGYHGTVVLPVQIQPLSSLPDQDTFTLRARADWLVCQEDCIPESADLELTLPTKADPAPMDPRWNESFATVRQRLPMPVPWPVSFAIDEATLTLDLTTGHAAERIAALEFFPLEDGLITHAAPQTLSRAESSLRLTVARGTQPKPPESVAGLLVVRERQDDGKSLTHAITFTAPRAGEPAPMAAPSPDPGLFQALVLALLGGVLLNLMPCVLPVLSLKALNLAQHAHHSPGAVRTQGLAYTAGVLVCFTAIAGVLIALRAAGQHVGWGFQLQSPIFVTLLTYLLFVLGLSLSGVFSFGGSLMGVGSAWADRPDYLGSFATGALAVVVATPCTAPFMGVALGFALTQNAWVSLAVFLALGLGLALPYLALSFKPGLLRFLPRPGPWLEHGKQLLAFPLYATAAWLVWVLSQQTGPDGVAAVLAGMILLAFAMWLSRATQAATPRWRLAGRLGAVLALVLALGLTRWPAVDTATAATRPASASTLAWESFSPVRLAELQATGRPVFVNFTAAWCITCLVNERMALNSARVAEELATKKVVVLKADWTQRDPAITQALAAFGRGGVPLYVLYPPRPAQPIILPQLLTESLLLKTLQTL